MPTHHPRSAAAWATYPSYRVTLSDADGRILWSGEGLTPSHLDTLTVSLPTSFLGEGDHEVRVEGRDRQGHTTPSVASPSE